MATTVEIVNQLVDKVTTLEAEIADLKGKTQVNREIQQVVIEKDGTVKAKVLLKTANGIREDWEDVTGKLNKTRIQEVLNGS